MNGRQAMFMIAESDAMFRRLERATVPGQMPPMPSDQETHDLLERAERLDWPWKRLWHRIKKPEWMRDGD